MTLPHLRSRLAKQVGERYSERDKLQSVWIERKDPSFGMICDELGINRDKGELLALFGWSLGWANRGYADSKYLMPDIERLLRVAEAAEEVVEWARHAHMLAGPMSKLREALKELAE